jgi:ABC-2 type transport system permease protein
VCVRFHGSLAGNVIRPDRAWFLRTFAAFTPLYGLSQLVHYPLVGGTLQRGWILNLAVWLAIFVAGAAWRLRRDTARV